MRRKMTFPSRGLRIPLKSIFNMVFSVKPELSLRLRFTVEETVIQFMQLEILPIES